MNTTSLHRLENTLLQVVEIDPEGLFKLETWERRIVARSLVFLLFTAALLMPLSGPAQSPATVGFVPNPLVSGASSTFYIEIGGEHRVEDISLEITPGSITVFVDVSEIMPPIFPITRYERQFVAPVPGTYQYRVFNRFGPFQGVIATGSLLVLQGSSEPVMVPSFDRNGAILIAFLMLASGLIAHFRLSND
jgi:hypothetical protein